MFNEAPRNPIKLELEYNMLQLWYIGILWRCEHKKEFRVVHVLENIVWNFVFLNGSPYMVQSL